MYLGLEFCHVGRPGEVRSTVNANCIRSAAVHVGTLHVAMSQPAPQPTPGKLNPPNPGTARAGEAKSMLRQCRAC